MAAHTNDTVDSTPRANETYTSTSEQNPTVNGDRRPTGNSLTLMEVDGGKAEEDYEICRPLANSHLPHTVSSKLQKASCIFWQDKSCWAPYTWKYEPSVYAFTFDAETDNRIRFIGVFCPWGEILDGDPACESMPAVAEILTELKERGSALLADDLGYLLASLTSERAVREDPVRPAHPSFTGIDLMGIDVRKILTRKLEERVPSHLRGPENVSRRTRFVYMNPSRFPDIFKEVEFDFRPYYDRPL